MLADIPAGGAMGGGAHQHLDGRFSHNQYYYDRGYSVRRPPVGCVGSALRLVRALPTAVLYDRMVVRCSLLLRQRHLLCLGSPCYHTERFFPD